MRHLFFFLLQGVIGVFPVSGGALADTPNAAHVLAEKFATNGKAKASPTAVKPSPEYEREMLDAARREAEARRKAGKASSETKSAETKAAESKAAQSTPPPAAAKPAVPQPQHMQIKVEAHINTPPSAPPPARDSSAPHASVLVVLTDAGIDGNALPRTPDPIICLSDICYVSAGPDKEAKVLARTEALSTKNTISGGAGACKGQMRCAFRGVTVQPGASLQIVDLGIVRHDRRETIEAKLDSTCAIDGDELVCDHPLTAPDYRIWIIPEAVAHAAGPAKIQAALDVELPEENVARDGDK